MLYADRVQETSTTSGTGTLTLAGAVSTFRSFASVFSAGDRVRYMIVDPVTGAWEIGDGIYSANTLTRDNVLSSSNANALVSFAANAKAVACVVPSAAISDMGQSIALKSAIFNLGQ